MNSTEFPVAFLLIFRLFFFWSLKTAKYRDYQTGFENNKLSISLKKKIEAVPVRWAWFKPL